MRQVVQTTLPIYRGLPWSQLFLYQEADGRNIDLTGKKAVLDLKASVDDADPPLYSFSTANGKITLGMGTIQVDGMTEAETAAFTWDKAVGHLVVEEIAGQAKPFAFIVFPVVDCTSGVPL